MIRRLLLRGTPSYQNHIIPFHAEIISPAFHSEGVGVFIKISKGAPTVSTVILN
jgi:hypothetical protein